MFINKFTINKTVQRTRVNKARKLSIRKNGSIGTANIGGITFFGRNRVGRKSTINRNRGRQVRVGNRNQKKEKENENEGQRGWMHSGGPLSAHKPVDCNHLIVWSP